MMRRTGLLEMLDTIEASKLAAGKGALVMASSGLDVPDDLDFPVADAYEAVPAADHGVLLGRQ